MGMDKSITKIKIVEDFSPSPGGRFRKDGPFSGEQFREDILCPALENFEKIQVELDGAFGYPSSFLEEAFGGLIRNKILNAKEAFNRISFLASESYEIYVEDIKRYLSNASKHGS